MKKIYLLPLIALLPISFLGNSPAPQAFTEEYNDFEIHNFVVDDETEEYKYPFSFQVTNIGARYLEIDDNFYFIYDKDKSNTYLSHHIDCLENECLAPGQSRTYLGYINSKFALDSNLITFKGNALNNLSDGKYTSIEYINSTYDKDLERYYYNYKVNDLKEDDYYYSYLIDFDYLETRYVIDVSNIYNETFSIILDELIDPNEDIKINKIIQAKGRKKNKGLGTTITVIFWVIAGSFVFSLIGGITVLIVFTVKKKRREKKA